jgi:3-dehydroquinate synthase
MSAGGRTLTVDVGHTRYPITIGPGLLGRRDLLDAQIPGQALLIVSNATIAPLYAARLRAGLGARRVVECVLPDGELHKTLQTAARVFDALVEHRFNRDATIVALGGGVVGDIAGFAAACYQRGIAFAQVPTTLLAQVDSSVGGKTGVNHPGGKNLIGAFHQPCAVLADTETLATLPDRELRAGLAEVIKYGCTSDPDLFAWLEAQVPQILARDPAALIHAIARSCQIKADIVAQDEREQDIRAILNFGHTFGHAIEAATAFSQYLHGEAVALGMLMATDLSRRLGAASLSDLERLRSLLTLAGLPTEAPRIGHERAAQLMHMDKKVLAGTVRLVLLERLGRAKVTGDYARDALDSVLREYFG